MTESARIAVIGAGTMGHGIAHVCAAAGYQVALFDPFPGATERGIARIGENLEKGVQRGKVTAEDAAAARARLTPALSIAEAVAGAGMLIEAVP